MNTRSRHVLILGGYGTFGGRLARLLAHEPRLTLIIAGRSRDKAAAFCKDLVAAAEMLPLACDRNGDLTAVIGGAKPDIIVDATGPFQAYGAAPYKVVQAALDLGIPYLDLSDGSDFVRGIAQFDAAAKARGIFILSGVSSFPVLTAAVVRRLSKDMKTVRRITGGIAPSPYAGVGENVVRAIASYAGKPVALMRGGREAVGYALTETVHYTIAPPGRLPLRNIRFSLIDVPDLQLLPDLWPGLESIWIGAGPVPEILHRALNGLARLVRLGVLRSLSPFAPLFYRAINILRWGEHRGGMYVTVTGADETGAAARRSWHLLAEGEDGPMIPSMAVEAIVRKYLDGHRPEPGARAATSELELEDYEALFAHRTIATGQRDDAKEAREPFLYPKLLGTAFAALPAPIRAMHQGGALGTASGMAEVERGKGLLARVVAGLVGFPRAGRDIPVSVRFERSGAREVWHRTFGTRSFSSIQEPGRHRSSRLLVERFGPFRFGLALVVDGEVLRLVVRNWSFLRLPLPTFLAPSGDSHEALDDGRFRFHVEIEHPLIGLIVRYSGWLEPGRDDARRAADT